MKRHRKGIWVKKIAKCISAGLGAGCRNKTVDYHVDRVTESEGAQENGSSGKKGVGQFAGASEWQDECTVVNAEDADMMEALEAERHTH